MTTAFQSVAPPVEPFDAVAEEYDSSFTQSLIGTAQRESVWRAIDHHFRAGQRILEINCGTGIDAMRLSARGIWVTACDASAKMVRVARRRRDALHHGRRVDFRVLPTERIHQLEEEGPYNGVLSNFAGLNCVADLRAVARDLARLVKPGDRALLCVFGRFCLWEMVWYLLQGNVRKAFRRLAQGSVAAHVGPGRSVLIRYPSIGSLRRDFAPGFRLLNWMGVGIAVPPSYLEPWARRFPRLLRAAARLDAFLGRTPGSRMLADHVVLVFERVAT